MEISDLKPLICCHKPRTLEQSKVWGKAHLLWYSEPLLSDNDIGPSHRHYVKALHMLMADDTISSVPHEKNHKM